MSSESPVSCCTRVFWDAVDFPFPKDLAPETIYNRMKLNLEEKRGFMGDLSIMAYVNLENFPDKSAYESAGFNIISHQERHRFMLRDIAWWEVDSTYTSTFRFRGPSKVTFVVISSLSEEESIFLTFLESLKSACYNVRLVVPDDDNHRPSPKLLDNTLSFEWLYHCLLQTGDLGDPKRMKITREVVQTTTPPSPPEPIPPVHSPAVFLDLPPLPLRTCYYPGYIKSYVRKAMGYFDGAFSIMAYVDDLVYTSFPDGWVDAFTECGITIIPQLADAHARAHRMSVDIVLWAMDHPATYFHPRDLLVFSENVKEGTNFYNALKALGERYYNVCVLPPPSLGSDVIYRQVFSNHMPRISREEDAIGFSSGLASLYHQDFDMSQIHVFCDAPTDISIILPALREKGYHGRVLFRPYLPYQADEPLLGYSELVYTRVPSIKVEGDSYAVSARMLLDILFWAMNHDDLPQNLILVSQPSKDIDIVVQALEHRGFNIIFKPSDDEVASHTINDRFESLCKSPPVAANQILLVSPCRTTITDVSRKLKGCPVIIFWLVDSCPSDPYEFRRKFRSTLEDKGYDGYVSVTAYVVKGVNTDEEIKVCRKSGLQVSITPQGDEYGKFSSMLLDMINWTQHCQAPFNFLVISDPFKNAVCDSVFADVTSRGFNVLCETVDYMVTFGSSLWSAESILDTSSSDS